MKQITSIRIIVRWREPAKRSLRHTFSERMQTGERPFPNGRLLRPLQGSDIVVRRRYCGSEGRQP